MPFDGSVYPSFRVETLVIRENRRLGRPRRDSLGYYQDIPVAVLGKVTQNNTFYREGPFIEQIRSPDSYVCRQLQDGKLYGEYGHPDLTGLDNQAAINRLAKVDEKCISHHFASVHLGQKLESGGQLICAHIRPHGPYKSSLEDSFEAPLINTAFSLRGITTNTLGPNGESYRTMEKLITFDAVHSGGYSEAAKRFAATESLAMGSSMEFLDVRIDPSQDPKIVFDSVAMESFTNTELNHLFGTNRVYKLTETLTYVPATESLIRGGSDQALSAYAALIRR